MTHEHLVAQLLMLGVDNRVYVPCVHQGGNSHSAFTSDHYITNTGSVNFHISFLLPLPTTRGTLKLYIDALKTGVMAADGSNFVSARRVTGITYDAYTPYLYENTGDITSQTEQVDTFTAIDCSSYDQILVDLFCSVGTAGNLDINFTALRCYYV